MPTLIAFGNIINVEERSADGQNESMDAPWPSVLRIVRYEEFQQSFAVAQLAVKLFEVKSANSKASLERENLDPKKFLADAWELIETARVKHVLRPQTELEYLVEQGGTREALADVFAYSDRKEQIPFAKLCDANRNKGDTEPINGVMWKVYRSERGFDDLFAEYWRDIGERWKSGDQAIGTVESFDTKGKPRKLNFYPESERKELATFASNASVWKKFGKSQLDSWKKNGVPPSDFLALAKFRRARDDRSANLKKPKRNAKTAANRKTKKQKQRGKTR